MKLYVYKYEKIFMQLIIICFYIRPLNGIKKAKMATEM